MTTAPLPAPMRAALADVFGVAPTVIDRVRVVERSRYCRIHGRRVAATTRRDRIYLAASLQDFIVDPELVLHEYFHVLRQWNRGTLTVWRYLVESTLRGYRRNRFEVEARAFAGRHAPAFAAGLPASWRARPDRGAA